MKFPYSVEENLSDKQISVWKEFYLEKSADWSRTQEEGIWRRTKSKENALMSDFTSESDYTKRMLHYKYEYDLNEEGKRLCLKDFYLWVFYTLPKGNLYFNSEEFSRSLKESNWILKGHNPKNKFYYKGDLELHFKTIDSELEEFISYEFSFTSKNLTISQEVKQRPWNILKTGIRKKGVHEDRHQDFKLEILKDLLPAQVELGCGPSIENNIPPLHFLHEVYAVTEDFQTKKFIFDPEKDTLLNGVLFDTESYFKILTKMFRISFLEKPRKFYLLLKDLHKQGFFVGDIINNNFDLMPTKVGLKEKFIRRFEEAHVAPQFKFDPRAKALFVFGLHADRRKTQAAARKKGLKIVYIDTEGFFVGDKFYPYPLENITHKDYLYKERATKAIQAISDYLKT